MIKTVNVVGKIYDFLVNTDKKINVIYGSAGSGKSYTLAYYIIFKVLEVSNVRVLITRKYNPSLKTTVYKLIKEILEELNVYYKENKTEQIITFANNSEIYFRGLDDAEKIKSAEFNIVWMEEATEFERVDFFQLQLRLRRKTAGIENRMYLTFNPEYSWLIEEFLNNERKDTAVLHTTYKDNVLLDKDYVMSLENLKYQDETYYQIYALGIPAKSKGFIYQNYKIIGMLPETFDNKIYGIDFGFNNPSVILEIGLKDDNIYIIKELYETHLTNEELITKLKSFVENVNSEIYADSAEPARIEEISRAGFNIFPAKKDVKDGIDFLKRKMIYLYKDCTNTIKEIQMYKWKENKNGEILDEPVKFNDHAMDALRYAVYTYYKWNKNWVSVFEKDDWGVF